jgi:DNA-binding response OmpR family regulator
MSKKHILIVDDEPKLALFLSKILACSNRNHQVSTANSGEKALEILRSTPVDLLITDLRMPGISGLELIRWVRASSPETRTILMTAYGSDNVEEQVHQMEVYRYITKPFDGGDMAQVVEEALKEVAISQPGLVVLSDQSFETIAGKLESLKYDVGAMCILLADMQGQLLVHVGRTEGVEPSTLLALLSGGFVTSAEIARQYGNGESINLHFHEGSRYEVYSANVGDGLFIAIIYDRHVQTSRIGMVWLYTRRTIEELLSLVSSLKDAVPTQTLDDDFGSSLMAEIDSAFGGLPTVNRAENAFASLTPAGNARNIRPMSNGTKPPSPDGAPRSATNAQARSRPDAMESSDPGLLDIEAAIKLGIIPPDLIESLSNKET